MTKLELLEERHAQDRFDAISDRRVHEWLNIDVPLSFEKTRAWCANSPGRDDRIDFVLSDEGSGVSFGGLVKIDHRNKNCELYMFNRHDCIGKGYGGKMLMCLVTYAFHMIGLKKIYLYVTDGNEAAIGFYKHHGFEQEAFLKSHQWFRGAFRHRVILSIFVDRVEPSKHRYYEEFL